MINDMNKKKLSEQEMENVSGGYMSIYDNEDPEKGRARAAFNESMKKQREAAYEAKNQKALADEGKVIDVVTDQAGNLFNIVDYTKP